MNQYSVGSALLDHFQKQIGSSRERAELTVSVNTVLNFNSQITDVTLFREPRVILKSHTYRDILNLAVACLFIEDKTLKSLIRLALIESPTTQNHAELITLVSYEYCLKEYLINLVDKKGFKYLFSIINFRTTRDNTKNILSIVRLKSRSVGTPRRNIPAKRHLGVGHRDNGSLLSPGSSQAALGNIESRERQVEIEKRRDTIKDTSLLILGMLE